MILRLLILALALILVGCGGGEDKAEPTQQDASTVMTMAGNTAGQEASPLNEPHLGVSEEGRFEVRWPSGCSKKRIREMPSKIHPGENYAVDVTCFRNNNTDVGCRVTAYNETLSGGPATPADVTGTISELVKKLGVEIWRQRPIVSNGREGMTVYCREAGGLRHVWIVGFIEHGRVLIAMAWDESDDLYNDPDVIRFIETLRSTS